MFRFLRRLALLAIAAGAAQAHAITIDFTGVVATSDAYNMTAPAVGETITGSFSFDMAAPANLVHTDGSTYLQRFMADYVGGENRLGLSGHATFSGGTTITLLSSYDGGDTSFNVFHDDFGLNELSASAETYDFENNGFSALGLGVYDFLGAATTLFPSSSSGLSFGQYVYAASAGVHAGGSFQAATPEGYFTGSFVPTSFTITASAVPETGNVALMLAGLGLVGLSARRGAKAARA